MNCKGEGSDDNILQIQKQMKYLEIKWAVLKWNDWWMLIKALKDLNFKMHVKVSDCLNDRPTDFHTLIIEPLNKRSKWIIARLLKGENDWQHGWRLRGDWGRSSKIWGGERAMHPFPNILGSSVNGCEL